MKYFSVLLFFFLLAELPTPASAEENRTASRTIDGANVYPDWLTNRPNHYEFSTHISNHDPLHQHSMQWDGQDWDPAFWNENWTPEIAITKLYDARVFSKQYRERTHRPKGFMLVLDVGPTFFKLSELDQQRSLKLLTDFEDVFGHGYEAVELRDWMTKRLIGSYTKHGLQLY